MRHNGYCGECEEMGEGYRAAQDRIRITVTEDRLSDGSKVYGVAIKQGECVIKLACASYRAAVALYGQLGEDMKTGSIETIIGG